MPAQNESGIISLAAAGAVAQHLRVKYSSGSFTTAGIADRELGTLEEAALAALDVRAIKLRNSPGTRKFIASAALAIGAEVYTAASGKVGASASTAYRVGIAVTASAADGDIIEVATDPGDSAVP